MASKYSDYGLQRQLAQAFQATASGGGPAYSATRHVQTMSVDDSANAIGDTDDAANDGGAVTNFFDKAFDAAPIRTGQSVACKTTYAAAEAIMTIRRILLHDDTPANVTSASTTMCGGVDGQAFGKTADFAVAITLSGTLARA